MNKKDKDVGIELQQICLDSNNKLINDSDEQFIHENNQNKEIDKVDEDSNENIINANKTIKSRLVMMYFLLFDLFIIMNTALFKIFHIYFGINEILPFSFLINFYAWIQIYYFMIYSNENIKSIFYNESKIVDMIAIYLGGGTAIILPSLIFGYLKLGYAITLINTVPIVVILISPLILDEKFKIDNLISCILCFIGLLITVIFNSISAEKDDNNYNLMNGIFCSLSFIISTSIFMIFSKKVSVEINEVNICYLYVFWGFVSIFIISIFVDFSHFIITLFNPVLHFISFISAFLSNLANIFMQKGIALDNLGENVYILYGQIPLSIIVGYVFFNEMLNFSELLGVLLIFITIMYYGFIKQKT